jgi:hypothetical protein
VVATAGRQVGEIDAEKCPVLDEDAPGASAAAGCGTPGPNLGTTSLDEFFEFCFSGASRSAIRVNAASNALRNSTTNDANSS